MRRGYNTLFQNNPSPMFDIGSMYKFGQPEPNPIESLGSRLKFGGDRNLADVDVTENPSNPNEPKFSATKALFEHLNATPKREDHQLSKMGTFAAALSGAAAGFKDPAQGVAIGSQMREAPFRRAMEEYGAKLPGLSMAADLESQTYGRDIAYQKMLSDHAQGVGKLRNDARGLDIEEGKLNETIANNKRDFDLNTERYKNEGWKEFTDDQGNMWMVNPQLPEGQNRRQIGKSIKSREVGALESNAAANKTSANASMVNANTNASRLQNVDIPVGQSTVGRNNALNTLTNEQVARSQDIDPQEQIYAQSLATKEAVESNPDWTKFINEDGTIKYPQRGIIFDDDFSGFEAFIAKVKELMSTDTGRPVLERKYKRPTSLNRSITIPQ